MTAKKAGRHGMTHRNKVILIIAGAILAVILCAVILNMRKAPKVTGLTGDPCYAQIDLSWDKMPGACGYVVYVSKDGEWEEAGRTEGRDSCEFAYADYEKDREYEFRVKALLTDISSDETREGEASDPVRVIYDSSLYASRIPVLTYHNITDGKTNPDDGLLISAENFDRQMKYLHDNGYKTLTMDEFRQWHEGRLEVPVKSCVITFDDGQAGVYYFAYPIIKKYGQAATVFCVGKHIHEKTDEFDYDDPYSCYMGEDAINEMREDYPDFQVESHTYAMHTRINGRKPLYVMSDEEISEDFEKNERFGFRYLAYPWGVYTKAMIEAAKEHGIVMAFEYDPSRYASRDDDDYTVSRVKVGAHDDFEKFVDTVNGNVEEYK